MKTLYCIRHGRARHNEDAEVYGREAYYRVENVDSGLVAKGIEQAQAVGASLSAHLGGDTKMATVDAVFTSSLSRALDTTKYLMAGFDGRERVPDVHVVDILRGFPFGSFMMAKRQPRQVLQERYEGWNFDGVRDEEDILWNSKLNRAEGAAGDDYSQVVKVDAEYAPILDPAVAAPRQLPETTDAFRARVRELKQLLWDHPARTMIVVAHDDIFCMLFNDHPDNGDFKNCHFYPACLHADLSVTRG